MSHDATTTNHKLPKGGGWFGSTREQLELRTCMVLFFGLAF